MKKLKEKFARWIVKKLCPGSHLAKNPPKGRRKRELSPDPQDFHTEVAYEEALKKWEVQENAG